MAASETFEQKMEADKKLSPEEFIKKIAHIKATCREYCGQCPSYAGTGEKELGFCMTGKSSVIKEQNGCLCSACPIQDELSLRWNYFCMRGSGKEQSAAGK